MQQFKLPYVVIGTGIAGLSTAIRLAADSKVAVITKQAIHEGATHYAQGGIAVALKDDDTPHCHLQDTLDAGAGLCHKDAVELLVTKGLERVNDLIRLGANFDKKGSSFDFTKEGAHQKRRVLHAKDSTGKEIEKTLGNYARSLKNIQFFPQTHVASLQVKNGVCQGCIAINDSGTLHFHTKSVIIASGGCGQVYSHTTNPAVCTGDGIALGYEAGCTVTDMEFVQFHPTTLSTGDKKPISIFLLSEALRGEGARLTDADGTPFMQHYHPLKELAPRDCVARAIFDVANQTKKPVYLHVSQLSIDVKSRFPAIYKRCLALGIDITKDPIPVSPAAHYMMGGIQTNLHAETSIRRLYAAGEVASLGLHGANRLASNSLLDGLVFGHQAAEHALNYKNYPDQPQNSLATHTDTKKHPLPKKWSLAKQSIQATLWMHVGIKRNASSLCTAKTALDTLNWILEESTLNTDIIEIKNMYRVALLITEFASKRNESRGAHFRSDFQQRKSNWKGNLVKCKNTALRFVELKGKN